MFYFPFYNLLFLESKSEEISFGDYSPSIGNQSERPANTSSLRSVRFAADLGFDDDQLLSSSPKSSSLKKKSSNLKTSPRDLNSSIDGTFNDGLSKPSRSREQNIVNKKEDVLKTCQFLFCFCFSGYLNSYCFNKVFKI